MTDAVLEEVAAWQQRPLAPLYAVIFFDALRVNISWRMPRGITRLRDFIGQPDRENYSARNYLSEGVGYLRWLWAQVWSGRS